MNLLEVALVLRHLELEEPEELHELRHVRVDVPVAHVHRHVGVHLLAHLRELQPHICSPSPWLELWRGIVQKAYEGVLAEDEAISVVSAKAVRSRCALLPAQ